MDRSEAYDSLLAIREDNSLRVRVRTRGARGIAACPAASFAASRLLLDSFWAAPGRYPIQILLTILASGPPCVILSSAVPPQYDPQTGRTFRSLHAECQSENKAAVVSLPDGLELLLAAFIDVESGNLPIFAGYLVSAGAPLVVGECISAHKLQVVLDLDETLLSAQAMTGLTDRFNLLSSRVEANSGQTHLRSIELDLLRKDINLLQQFTDSDAVTVDGKPYFAIMEAGMDEDGADICRPVIRLPDYGIVLSRMNPARPDTSMILRIRSGWEDLFSYLRTSEGKLRFDVYVATAAERSYALEAWRLLDPTAQLIPREKVRRRVVCIPGSKHKRLEKVFNLQHSENPPSFSPSPMPTSIILDDRLEVWEQSQRNQVFQVSPYFPLKEMAMAIQNAGFDVRGFPDAVPAVHWASRAELQRCQGLLASVRSSIFYTLDQKLKSTGGDWMVECIDWGLSLPKLPTVLQQCAANFPPVAATYDAAVLPKTPCEGVDLQPQDPRAARQPQSHPASVSPSPQYSMTIAADNNGASFLGKRPTFEAPYQEPGVELGNGNATEPSYPQDPRAQPGSSVPPQGADPNFHLMAPPDRSIPPPGMLINMPPPSEVLASMPPFDPRMPPPSTMTFTSAPQDWNPHQDGNGAPPPQSASLVEPSFDPRIGPGGPPLEAQPSPWMHPPPIMQPMRPPPPPPRRADMQSQLQRTEPFLPFQRMDGPSLSQSLDTPPSSGRMDAALLPPYNTDAPPPFMKMDTAPHSQGLDQRLLPRRMDPPPPPQPQVVDVPPHPLRMDSALPPHVINLPPSTVGIDSTPPYLGADAPPLFQRMDEAPVLNVPGPLPPGRMDAAQVPHRMHAPPPPPPRVDGVPSLRWIDPPPPPPRMDGPQPPGRMDASGSSQDPPSDQQFDTPSGYSHTTPTHECEQGVEEGELRPSADPNVVLHNSVTLLNEAGQKSKKSVSYTQGKAIRTADGKPCWKVEVLWGGESIGDGDGKTKKDAKKMAAFNALAVLGLPRPFTHNDCIPRYRESSTGAN